MALTADLKALTTLLKALLIKEMNPLNKLSSNSVSLSNFVFFQAFLLLEQGHLRVYHY